MSMNMRVHSVTAIRLEDRQNDGHAWVNLVITSTDYAGRESEVTITAHPHLKGMVLRVDQPEDDEPAEPDEAEPRGPCEPIGYEADMRNAGRGELLGDR
jgi:hypothetical protein